MGAFKRFDLLSIGILSSQVTPVKLSERDICTKFITPAFAALGEVLAISVLKDRTPL